MKILNLFLKNYRNYDDLLIDFNSNQNIIIGDNAQGKTNIIEAIYYLAITKSFLINNDKSVIKNNSNFSKIEANILNKSKKIKLGISLGNDLKKIEINKKEIKKHSEYIGTFKVILFSPDNVRILKEGPINRRKFLNVEISQLYNKYVNILNDYNAILKQRNEYLRYVKINNNVNKIYLEVLNDKYVSNIISIINYRNDFINLINKYIDDIYYNIASEHGLYIKYLPCTNICHEKEMYDNLISKINSSYEKEVMYGSSLIGVHKEDFVFYLNDIDLSLYGSQGQVRMAILSLKLAESYVFKDICGESPVLLLDDIFSELDINKRNNLIKYLNSDMQSIITTTDLNDINDELISTSKIFKIANGSVTEDITQEGE